MISPTEDPESHRNTWPNLEREREAQGEGGEAYFSLPSPQTAILLLSGDQAMSRMGPAIGWYSYFKMCSFCVVSQILILPDTSARGGERLGGWSLAQKATPTSRCDVESAGCVASDGGVHRVLCIYVSYSWVLGRQVSSVVVKQEKETSHPSLRNETYHTHTGTIMKPLLSLESPTIPPPPPPPPHSLLLT